VTRSRPVRLTAQAAITVRNYQQPLTTFNWLISPTGCGAAFNVSDFGTSPTYWGDCPGLILTYTCVQTPINRRFLVGRLDELAARSASTTLLLVADWFALSGWTERQLSAWSVKRPSSDIRRDVDEKKRGS